MASTLAQKDVEALLLKERVFRRRPGEVPYPLNYSKQMVNYDHWDHMWLSSCFKGLTLHQFETSPKFVLDLGCGSGLWAIEAARKWTDSTVIGIDIRRIQPRIHGIDQCNDLAGRLNWIQGNILDGLHFPPDYFDLVRIARIGLGVPEDEWQFVLEEVLRVMKPGAVLEIIEEDLIFPSGEFSRPRPQPAPLNIDLPIIDSFPSGSVSARSSITSSNPWISSQDDLSLESSTKKPNLSPLQESPTSTSSPPSTYSTSKSPLSSRSYSYILPPTPIPTFAYQSHPQDHSRLKSAWEAMLSHRFLASQLVTVLPFYLSSCFTDVKTHAPLNIPLPPNSPGSRLPRIRDSGTFDLESHFKLHATASRHSDSEEHASRDSCTSQSRKSASNWASMHLARAVQMVVGCKEAIWVEYERMYSPDLPPVTTGRRKDGRYQVSNKSIAKESFDWAWANWESDMMDRIGMREHLASELTWPEAPGERPDWRVWRNSVDMKPVDEMKARKDLCRSLRGFVARKPH
ncbi:hypothetical protein E1B28_011164 [Marasmius oreades]|uniref:Methyltransferase domain-containing protein n=1 Tax=Marasmius oreades TaxID=181124 RepID=A0A9P7RTI2_9AGAR|nr:uncharacterized protein E1B28_011164 [Marasmius oreades]KAG7089484.1 hypothetical protein E1B28_011164 [Marasmius oreades]